MLFVPKKKLSVANIKKENALLSRRKTINVKGYEVEIDLVFRKTEINKLVIEMVDKIAYMEREGYTIGANFLLYILILKYFTNIGVPEDFQEQVDLLNMMIDTDLLTTIVEGLPADQISEIMNGVNGASSYLESLETQNIQVDYDLLKERIANGDVEIEGVEQEE